jgi:hypothetical protein
MYTPVALTLGRFLDRRDCRSKAGARMARLHQHHVYKFERLAGDADESGGGRSCEAVEDCGAVLREDAQVMELACYILPVSSGPLEHVFDDVKKRTGDVRNLLV